MITVSERTEIASIARQIKIADAPPEIKDPREWERILTLYDKLSECVNAIEEREPVTVTVIWDKRLIKYAPTPTVDTF